MKNWGGIAMGLFKWIRTSADVAFLEDDTDDDIEATECNTYICERCGTKFVLFEAVSQFEGHFHGDLSYQDFWEKLCGDCAIDEIESKMVEIHEDEDVDYNNKPEGCTACGNLAYPNCTRGCPMFDN